MTKTASILGDSYKLIEPCSAIYAMWKKKWQTVFLPLPPHRAWRFVSSEHLLVRTSGLDKFKAQFSISVLLKVTVFDKSYSPGCQITLTWAKEGKQKNKEAKFYSLVFRKWSKINLSKGEAPALTDILAKAT